MRTLALALLTLVAATLAACGAEQGSDGMTIKIPHLIGGLGTPNEVDYGPYLDMEHYWNDKLGLYVAFDRSGSICYENDDCTGKQGIGVADAANAPYQVFNGQTTIQQATDQVADFVCASGYTTHFPDGTGICSTVVGAEDYHPYLFTDTGIAIKKKVEPLIVVLR